MHTSPSRISGLASAWRRWRGRAFDRPALDSLPCLAVAAGNIETLADPAAFRAALLELIGQARRRILIPALYLQDDDAGRAVLAALYAAKQAQPQLQVGVFVDWHRAQRGAVGHRQHVRTVRHLHPGRVGVAVDGNRLDAQALIDRTRDARNLHNQRV